MPIEYINPDNETILGNPYAILGEIGAEKVLKTVRITILT